MEYTIPIYTAIFVFGIMIGSFLNVCIFRLPDNEDIVSKRSHCPRCGNVLKWYELIPLLSFIIQRGRCRHCGTKISWQYPLIEALNGFLYLWIIAACGLKIDSILFCLCTSVLIVITVIDWQTYEIPLGCNILIGALGAARLLLDLAHWYDYVLGLFSVSGLFLLIYLLSKGRGIGGGDIKLMAAAGLLLTWPKALLAMALAAIGGSVIHLILMKVEKRGRVLAFGPYLSGGIFIAMLYGDLIIDWYLSMFLY